MFAIGVALGPFNHYWYVYLDRFFPGIKRKTIFKKVILDEIVASPFFIVAFFVGEYTVNAFFEARAAVLQSTGQ